MATQDRETTVVQTSSGNAGWFIAIVLVIVLAGAVVAYYNDWLPGTEPSIEVELNLPGAG